MKSSVFQEPSLQLVDLLRQKIQRMEAPRRQHDASALTTGCQALDSLLPDKGLPRGSLVEWLAAPSGSGAATLALIAAREAAKDGGAVVALDRTRSFYPPAARALGMDLEGLVVVRPETAEDELWVLDAALRCAGVSAVWAQLNHIPPHAFRRLQLAAQEGGGLGLFRRPAAARGQPTWAQTQFWVQPQPSASSGRRLLVQTLRCRGGNVDQPIELEIDERTGAVRQVDSYATTPTYSIASL